MIEEVNSIKVFTYPISYDELIETWVKENERFGHCLILYEPNKHEKYIKNIKLPYLDTDMYLAEVMCIEFLDFESAKTILLCFDYKKGPFVQLWSSGKLITDNIENAI